MWTAPGGIGSCQQEVVIDLRPGRPTVQQMSRIGRDTSKHVSQLHGVNAAEAPVLRKKLRRGTNGDGQYVQILLLSLHS
jgi:hypothetical protein